MNPFGSTPLTQRLRHAWQVTRRIVTVPAFWLGVLGIVAFWFAVVLVFDNLLMPAYTRHADLAVVPDTRTLPLEAARQRVLDAALTPQVIVQRYNPDRPRDIVLSQEPLPNAQVKPGRRVYLTVNNAQPPRVAVPDLKDISLREAKSRISAHRLDLGTVTEDRLPSPFANTITRQSPAPGDSVERGTRVHLWVSTGPGQERIEVPDVTDLHVAEALELLAQARLRVLMLEDPTIPHVRMDTVVRQTPFPGTSVPVGSEVRLYALTSEDYTLDDAEDDPTPN